MAGYVKTLGFGGGVAAGATSIISVAGVVPVGNRVIIGFSSTNLDTDPNPTCIDARGNVYTLDRPHEVPSRQVAQFSAPITTALQNGDLITVQHASCFQRVAVAREYEGIGAKEAEGSNNAISISPSSGATTARITPASIIIGVCGWNGVDALDTFSAGAGFGNANYWHFLNAGSARYVAMEDRIMSATGTESATGTISVSRNWSMIAVAYPILSGGRRLVNNLPLKSLVGRGLAG